jgi:multidrug efflux pump subunit AcrB
MGIAFSIAGTFWVLNMAGHTLNVSVLLGVVIVLGMLVDDAVVVVESLYYRLQRGQQAIDAALDALREVVRPVTSAVFTTISAFLPLMLLPGILGDFMLVVPLVVTIGLLISLIEAYWILPSHVIGISQSAPVKTDPLKHWRGRWTHNVRVRYTKALAYVFRRPKRFFAIGIFAFVLSATAFMTGAIKVNFFTMDPIRMFYVNVDMPPRAPLEETLAQTVRVEDRLRPLIPGAEVRAITSMAGLKFTDAEILYGDNYGQIQVSLNPKERDSRTVSEIVDSVREAVLQTPGEANISFFEVSGGPPVTSDVEVRVRGDDTEELRAAAAVLMEIVAGIEGAENVVDDDVPGRYELTLDLDNRAIREAGLSPGNVARMLRLHVDGEIIAFTRDQGEKLELRVKGPERRLSDIDAVLDDPILLPDGGTTTFAALTKQSVSQNSGSIKHYNYRRSIKVQADLSENSPNTIAAVNYIRAEWAKVNGQFNTTTIDFSGPFEDIEESLDAMGILFLFGIGLIYLILATQFRSYFQPMLIIVSVPMAFTGVSFGLFVTQQPLSLFTLYGIVALTGIAVNAAIVLIDATNARIAAGMRPLHAVVYAARRRVIPILMTTMTTIAGLFSLATGLGGKSLLWGPVAASMVFGLFVATTMTLFLVPVLFRLFMRMRDHRVQNFFRRILGRSLLPTES